MPVDRNRFTALAILAIKDRDTFPLLFYRKDCADMAIAAEDVDADWIATSQALAITGTHLSTETTQGACRAALDAARQHGLKRILDIDYRPVLWGLAELGDGETRYVDDAETTAHLQRWIGDFDLIVGTEEEFHIAGGTTDTIAALKKVRELSDAVLVCKLGALGCTIFEGPVGDSVHDGVLVEGVKVEVLNVLGAGDAFISGFLRGYLRGESWETCATYANACGALVVSRHGCAPAMPTEAELFDYLERRDEVAAPGPGRAPQRSASQDHAPSGDMGADLRSGVRSSHAAVRHGRRTGRGCRAPVAVEGTAGQRRPSRAWPKPGLPARRRRYSATT